MKRLQNRKVLDHIGHVVVKTHRIWLKKGWLYICYIITLTVSIPVFGIRTIAKK